MAVDVDSDNDREAKVPLQSAESSRIRVISGSDPDGNVDHGRNGLLDNNGGDAETAALRNANYRKMDAADNNATKYKPPLARARSDSRAFGISRNFDRFTRFLGGKPSREPGDADSVLDESLPLYRTTPKRWLVLLVFACYSMSNAFQWISYGIIADKIILFYDVSAMQVDWLSMIYMLTYIPLVFPATWLLDKKGLRVVALIGSFGNFVGAAIKCFSPYPNRFAVTFLGQTISACSQIFILGLPARLAAVWFGASEVAFATAIGVFGNQMGVAMGFLLPPILVPTIENATVFVNSTEAFDNMSATSNLTARDLYGQNLATMFYGSTAINGFLFLIVVFIFQDAPRYPPSPAQAAVLAEAASVTYLNWIVRLVKNWNFVVLLLSYGINVGAFYAISTLLNRCILIFFPGADEDAGRIGFTIVLAGLLGSFIGGLWLSWSGNYKTTTFVIYLLSFLSMIVFTATLNLQALWLVYLVAGSLGFFMTGYLPVGFEFAAEITYPAPEGTSSGLLNCSAQIYGFLMTSLMSAIFDAFDPITANGVIAGCLFVGTVMTFFIKSDLRRTTVTNQMTANNSAVFPQPTGMAPQINIENIQMVPNDVKMKHNQLVVA